MNLRGTIRWKQRFEYERKALQPLTDAVALAQTRALSTPEGQGVLQLLECTLELAGSVLKDYLVYQGVANIVGSRGAVREPIERIGSVLYARNP